MPPQAVSRPLPQPGLQCRTIDYRDWPDSWIESSFDVVMGEVNNLRPSEGVADASCMGEDLADPWMTHDPGLSPGEGVYYLVRSQAPTGEKGSYDTTTDPTVREGRDLEVGGGDCL